MDTNFRDPAVQAWPKMPQVVNEAAARLHTQYGNEGMPSEALKREIERIGDYGRDSVVPSDYCYNVINRASSSFRHRVLVRVRRGRYKYVGPNHVYTGPIMWRPKQENERQVGSWSNGICGLELDPRG